MLKIGDSYPCPILISEYYLPIFHRYLQLQLYFCCFMCILSKFMKEGKYLLFSPWPTIQLDVSQSRYWNLYWMTRDVQVQCPNYLTISLNHINICIYLRRFYCITFLCYPSNGLQFQLCFPIFPPKSFLFTILHLISPFQLPYPSLTIYFMSLY